MHKQNKNLPFWDERCRDDGSSNTQIQSTQVCSHHAGFQRSRRELDFQVSIRVDRIADSTLLPLVLYCFAYVKALSRAVCLLDISRFAISPKGQLGYRPRAAMDDKKGVSPRACQALALTILGAPRQYIWHQRHRACCKKCQGRLGERSSPGGRQHRSQGFRSAACS